MRTSRLIPVLAVVLGALAAPPLLHAHEEPSSLASKAEAQRAFLEALHVVLPELDYEPSGYPVFSEEAQQDAFESYRRLLSEY